MRFPNAYRGVRRLFTSELLIWFSVALTVLFPFGFQIGSSSEFLNRFLTVLILVFTAAAAVTRVLAIGCVSIDEEAFLSGQRSTLIAYGFLLNNLIVLPLFTTWFTQLEQSKAIVLYKDLLTAGRICLPIVMQAAALYYYLSATLILIFGTECLACKLKDKITIEQGTRLKWLVTGLFFAALLASILNAALPDIIVYSLLFRVSVGGALLAYLIVTGVFVLRYLRHAEDMLFYAKSKDVFIWTGLASELIPDKFLQDTDVEPDYDPDDDDVHYWPVEALNAPSKWARDAELFFKGELRKDENAAETETKPEESRISLCLKRLFAAETVCLFTLLIVFLFTIFSPDTPSLDSGQDPFFLLPTIPWFCSLFGKIAWYLQWSALRLASIEPQPWYLPSRKMLERAFWTACIVFVMPVFMTLWRIGDGLDFEFFAIFLRLFWVTIPVLATPRILNGLGYLAELKQDWDEVRHWKWLRRGTYCVFLLLCLSVVIPTGLFPILTYLFSIGVWAILLRDLFRTRQALRAAEEAEQNEL